MWFATALLGYSFDSKKLWRSIFDVYDMNQDGAISWREYFNMICKPIGISEDDAKEYFDIIDADGNGVLNLEDFTLAFTNYFKDLENIKMQIVTA